MGRETRSQSGGGGSKRKANGEKCNLGSIPSPRAPSLVGVQCGAHLGLALHRGGPREDVINLDVRHRCSPLFSVQQCELSVTRQRRTKYFTKRSKFRLLGARACMYLEKIFVGEERRTRFIEVFPRRVSLPTLITPTPTTPHHKRWRQRQLRLLLIPFLSDRNA